MGLALAVLLPTAAPVAAATPITEAPVAETSAVDSSVADATDASDASDVSVAETAGVEAAAAGFVRVVVQLVPGGDAAREAAGLVPDGEVSQVYSEVFEGFAAEVPEAALPGLRQNPRVASVQVDTVVRLTATQSPSTWGLDRVDQRTGPLTGSFSYPSSGAGVTAYVVDTGIRADHVDLGGRVRAGYTVMSDGQGTSDCNGHGTHVAGTISGGVHGLAKSASLVPVRVLNCYGGGNVSMVLDGLDWIIADHQAGVPAVANLSLGTAGDPLLDRAVQALVDDGVTVVVAAGNAGGDACLLSPARLPAVITVGATDQADARATFSSYGSCIDIFAPGVGITSTWHTSRTATGTISGTSMASPHVAGAAALLLAGDTSLSPAGVAKRLLEQATTGVVTQRYGSPDRLLFVAPTCADGDRRTAVDRLPRPGVVVRSGYTYSLLGIDDANATTSLAIATLPSITPVVSVWENRTGCDGEDRTRNSWAVTPAGKVYAEAYGEGPAAAHHGDASHLALNKPVVGMSATASGNGYWLVASDGGIFTFGDAKFFGSTGAMRLNKPIVGMSTTPTGKGYWLVASDGGIFTFGDARFFGSTGALKLDKPVTGMTTTPSGKGYWLVASDGGIFTFGDAAFRGSTGGRTLSAPIAGMLTRSTGYVLVGQDAKLYPFG